jgi:Methylamine utilisation protein MauE
LSGIQTFSPTRAVAAIVSTGFAIGVALSMPLWCSNRRLYPRAPLIRGWNVPPRVEWILVACLLAILTVLAIRFRPPIAWAVLAIVSIFALLDQSRMQPWVYEYCVLLIALAFLDRTTAANACRVIVIALYFWSAVQKMNVTFISKTWPELSSSPLLNHIGWMVPVVELAIAIGLWSVRARRVAVIGAVATHAVILVLLVSSGENSVVWPWNVASAFIVIVLFWSSRERIALDGGWLVRALTATVWILPLLSLFGWWDAYLSFALYAGNTMQAVVIIPPENVPRLPDIIRRNTWQASEPMFIDLNRWSYDELSVPAYPAERVMTAIGLEVCRGFAPAGTVEILGRPDWQTGRRESTFIRSDEESGR